MIPSTELQLNLCSLCKKNEPTDGYRTCAECRGEGIRMEPLPEPKPVQAQLPYRHPIIGVSLEAQQLIDSSTKRATARRKQRVPHVTVECPCGKRWSVTQHEKETRNPRFCCPEHARKYAVHARPRFQPTPEEMDEIKKFYLEDAGLQHKGGPRMERLAAKFGVPRQTIYYHAKKAGWAGNATARKSSKWTDAEMEILKDNIHESIPSIMSRLASAGYGHCYSTVCRMRSEVQQMQSDKWSAFQISELMGVRAGTITGWIKEGRLKAMEYPNKSGSHGSKYIITNRDLREFIINNALMVDLRKVRRTWFIGLMAERLPGMRCCQEENGEERIHDQS